VKCAKNTTDRAFRIGQKKNFNVYRFVTKNSFKEKIDKMIKSKQELTNLTVSTQETWLGNLSNDELKYIFSTELNKEQCLIEEYISKFLN
jgi:SNF2 family DNA or RNA helicase